MRVNVFGNTQHFEVIELDTDAAGLEIEGLEETEFSRPLHVTVTVTRTETTACLAGVIESEILLECARCLEEFQWRLSTDFTLVVKQLHEGENLRNSEADDDDATSMIVLAYGENEVDIEPYVRDAVILALPMKPVCREDCPGLCPICGSNISAGPCGCVSEHHDARWEALKKISGENGKAGK